MNSKTCNLAKVQVDWKIHSYISKRSEENQNEISKPNSFFTGNPTADLPNLIFFYELKISISCSNAGE